MVYFGDPPRPGTGKWKFYERPSWIQKYHFIRDKDILEKRRLAERSFGHIRHTLYRTQTLTQPSCSTTHHVNDEERFSRDIPSFIKKENEQLKARKKEILGAHVKQRAIQEYNGMVQREKEWEKEVQRESFFRNKPHARIVSNKLSMPFNFINRQYHDEYAGQKLKHQDMLTEWRACMRSLRLRTKLSGARNYNIITWERNSPIQYPAKPMAPVPVRPKTSMDLSSGRPDTPFVACKFEVGRCRFVAAAAPVERRCVSACL